MQSHHQNSLRTLLDDNINTLIKQSDRDIIELTEIVRGKQQVNWFILQILNDGQPVPLYSYTISFYRYRTPPTHTTQPAQSGYFSSHSCLTVRVDRTRWVFRILEVSHILAGMGSVSHIATLITIKVKLCMFYGVAKIYFWQRFIFSLPFENLFLAMY